MPGLDRAVMGERKRPSVIAGSGMSIGPVAGDGRATAGHDEGAFARHEGRWSPMVQQPGVAFEDWMSRGF
jgi:hypothetical protein